jgi:hypothetical protein
MDKMFGKIRDVPLTGDKYDDGFNDGLEEAAKIVRKHLSGHWRVDNLLEAIRARKV